MANSCVINGPKVIGQMATGQVTLLNTFNQYNARPKGQWMHRVNGCWHYAHYENIPLWLQQQYDFEGFA